MLACFNYALHDVLRVKNDFPDRPKDAKHPSWAVIPASGGMSRGERCSERRATLSGDQQLLGLPPALLELQSVPLSARPSVTRKKRRSVLQSDLAWELQSVPLSARPSVTP